MNNRKSKVKAYFENDQNYLGSDGRTIGIMSRQEIVQSMLSGKKFNHLLDVPCGNGLVSIPLAPFAEKMTLIDIAERMIKAAKSNLPKEYEGKVNFKHGDVFQMDLSDASFDCVLAIGILAHVDDPTAFLDLVDRLLAPGGSLIIQNTDHDHFKVKLQKLKRKGAELSQAGSYDLNSIKHSWLSNYFKQKEYTLQHMYRYETRIPFLLSGKGEKGLKEIWSVYGRPPSNRLSWMGSKCIYHYQK